MDFIRLYPDLVPAAMCERMIEAFERDPRKRPGVAHGNARAKRSTDLSLRGLAEWADACAALDEAVSTSLRAYRREVPNFADVHGSLRDTGYQLQRYLPNGEDGFDWHADVASRESSNRVLAMITYLNTVEVGGETEFRAQERAIPPRQGAVAWFPPGFEYVHRGRPPVSGPKYVVTSFLVYP